MRCNKIQVNKKRTLLLTFLFILTFQKIIAINQDKTELLDSIIFEAQSISDSSKTEALKLFNYAFNILSNNDNQKDILDFYLKIGKEFSVLNNKNRALEILINGLELSTQYADSARMWEFIEAIGLLYHEKAIYTKSLDHFITSLNIAENIKDTLKVAQSCDRIATILKEQKEYNKALEYLNKSLRLKTKINDNEGKLSTLITIADINTLLKNLNHSIELYKRSETIAHKLSNKKELSRIYSNMGNCYFYMKNYTKAEVLYLKGIEIKKDLGDKYRLAIAYNNLSIFYKRISKFDAAYDAASKSLNLSKEVSAAYVEMSCYLNLSHYFKLNKNFEKAYGFQRKYAHLKDSLFNDKKSKQLTEIREKYETEKKEQQIEFLEIENKTQEALIKKNRIIRNTISVSGLLFLLLFVVSMYAYKQKQKANRILSDKNIKINDQNIELDKLNKTKNKLFSIIAHDLRSPLSSIEGVSELISKLLEQG
ncbi:MAG: tetratricopeptide repeat protein, partial [Gammaproteobacteria bacterium]|nr:tetratricopeptide repeat protein [Gammaproteobacteria bacterium]